ncbi:MAG: response regulator transcription factor [Deltaproteobacteria bacterium]|nr:response regulator transcription factor [Deltaproteobacteria bacterium]
MTERHRAIIADDEKPLRDYLKKLLEDVWPDLLICGEAANGQEALVLVRRRRPHVAFLDIRMPGLSGMEAAREIGGSCHVVFVSAYDQFAVEAFEREAVDYLLKPVTRERLTTTVERLKERLAKQKRPFPGLGELTERILSELRGGERSEHLAWIRAQHRDGVRLIPVEEVCFFKADEKYTLVMTDEGEFLIKKGIKELAADLDPDRFWQIHRGAIVNVARVEKVSRSLTGRGVLRLKGRSEILTVSRRFLHLFRQM